jgi:4,5-dihydroxyphthalate decarboxylase
LITLASGDDRYVGLPVFTTYRFIHNMILVRRDAGIDKPEDMRAKRIGVPEYQQTAALWARGILKHEFGVDQTEIEWWMERTPKHRHAGASGFKAPPGTTINQIPGDKNIGSMMLAGEMDGNLFWIGGGANIIDRTIVDLPNHPDMKTLFPDPIEEGCPLFAGR